MQMRLHLTGLRTDAEHLRAQLGQLRRDIGGSRACEYLLPAHNNDRITLLQKWRGDARQYV